MQLTRRLDENHDMTFGRGLGNFARDAEACAQNVRTRLMMLLGEWFLDTSTGVPYLQSITAKPMDLNLAESIFKKTILDTDGVLSINSFSMVYSGRVLTIRASISTVYGNTINIQVRK